ncbi:MAG: hypothetical protein V7K32_27300 [Nostoc sp.]|uniref:hypothetical protein n=1 Tax=Nostoc sp. TaxID=1180 RepID=UPI002FF62F01
MSLSISNVFDANFYRAANSDLAALNDTQALSHFQAYGLNEGRSFSPLVDLSFYRASNSDLKNLNNSQLLDHLENYGVAEGRTLSPLVDLNYYRANNSDLANLNNEQLFNHLENNGISEGRTFDPLFGLGQYKSLNSDLANLNNSQLLNHLEINGINEGRKFSAYFDFNYYRTNNQDLANLNNSQLLQHFETYGINEGRKSSPYFDAGFYKANNSDLASLKGINLLEHFDEYGEFEGRQAASEYAGNTLSTAPELTIGSNYTFVLGHVGSSEPSDYYQFNLSQASTVTIYDYGLSRSVGEEILNSNGQVVNSRNSGVYNSNGSVTGNPSLSISLNAGTYYLDIQPQAGNTNYDFYLNATPQVQSQPSNTPVGTLQAQLLNTFWGDGIGVGAAQSGPNQIDFLSNGSYVMAKIVNRTGISSYSISSDTIIRGNFTVNGSTIQLYPQTVEVDNYPIGSDGIALAPTTQISNVSDNTPISYSASLQSNNVLVLTDTNGNAITYFIGQEAFAIGLPIN